MFEIFESPNQRVSKVDDGQRGRNLRCAAFIIQVDFGARIDHNQTLALQFMISGETKGQDTIHGVPTSDTAETIVYVGPQASYTWSARLSAQLGFDYPVGTWSSGDQMVPGWRLRAAVNWRF